jgi:hypothetical protein
MKITIEVDCTPQEARAFLGLPDLGPLQEEVMADLSRRMKEAAAAFEPEAALKAWMGASAEGMEQMMRLWSRMAEQGKETR